MSPRRRCPVPGHRSSRQASPQMRHPRLAQLRSVSGLKHRVRGRQSPGRKKLRHSATMTAAIIDNREIAGRCRKAQTSRQKYTVQPAPRSRTGRPSQRRHYKICARRYAACPAGAFRCIRYRKAYHSLCFRGLAMAPKISEITLTIMTSEPHTITPAEMAA